MDIELVVKVIVAALLGGAIGLEREIGGHEPGLRTHALVAIGAALFTVAGAYGFGQVRDEAMGDPAKSPPKSRRASGLSGREQCCVAAGQCAASPPRRPSG